MATNQLAISESQIGPDLLKRRKSAGLTRAEAAAAIGVDPQTIYRWERNERGPGADLYVRALQAYADAERLKTAKVGQMVPRGTSDLTEHLGSLVSAFERDMVRLGATDAEADYVRAALTSDEARRFYLGDPSAPLEPDQQERELKLQMEALRTWVQLRIRARDGAVDDRPSYLRVAEQYGGEVATGSTELPGNKKAPAKKTASADRKKPKR